MSIERTVTVSLPKNIDAFLVAYAKLLRYKSVEDFLKEEIELHFDEEGVRNRFDVYFDNNIMEEIQRRYGLTKEKPIEVEAK